MSFEFVDAVKSDDLRAIRALISDGAFDLNERLPAFEQPPALVLAARCKNAVAVELLLKAGAHVDKCDSFGRTACHVAAVLDDPASMAVLLRHGANLELRDRNGQTAVEIAILAVHCRTAAMLIDAGASLNQGFLIFGGASLNHEFLFDSPPVYHGLRFDSSVNNTAVVRALLKRGIMMARWLEPYSTINHAVSEASLDAVNMVIHTSRYDVNIDGGTCCHSAARLSPQVLRCLIEGGADFDSTDHKRKTPLHVATRFVSCTLLLVAVGANVNAQCSKGRTALHFKRVMPTEWVEIVAPILLAAGADIDIPDQEGKTARQILAERRVVISAKQIECARRSIAMTRFDLTRRRAYQVCVGLQSLALDALQLCEILQHACTLGESVRFHQWWAIATTVKHFRSSR